MFPLALAASKATASYLPVEVPEGTAALKNPRFVLSSHSIVGTPLLSNSSLAVKEVIFINAKLKTPGLTRLGS
jgi:hypothetical protein